MRQHINFINQLSFAIKIFFLEHHTLPKQVYLFFQQNCTYNENSIRGQLSRFTPLNSGLQHKQETDNVFTVKARQVPDPRQSQRSINYQKVDCTNEKKLKQDEGVIKKPLLPKNEAVLKNKENIAEIQKAADPEKRNKGNVYESKNNIFFTALL